MPVYATAAQYSAFAEEPFDGSTATLQKRLRSASAEVAVLTRGAVYAADSGGLPTDDETAAAFADATCAIVEHWEANDDPFGVEANAGAVKIGSVTLGTTSSSASNLSQREKLERRIGERALTILTGAGLIGAAVAHS